jgi:hypothetical protein
MIPIIVHHGSAHQSNHRRIERPGAQQVAIHGSVPVDPGPSGEGIGQIRGDEIVDADADENEGDIVGAIHPQQLGAPLRHHLTEDEKEK